MHSSWKHPYPDERQVLRRKVTAKARRGLHSHEEDLERFLIYCKA
jgi:hypothetical protein